LLAGVHPVLAQPALGIVPTNNQVILFWPITGDGTNGDLQSATDLVSQNWLSATDAFPVNYGSQIAVSVTNVSAEGSFGCHWFLRQPMAWRSFRQDRSRWGMLLTPI
jgi:hypothetical protein